MRVASLLSIDPSPPITAPQGATKDEKPLSNQRLRGFLLSTCDPAGGLASTNQPGNIPGIVLQLTNSIAGDWV